MSKHDLLIIGAGLAGLRAAVEGVRQGLNVAVITKVHPVEVILMLPRWYKCRFNRQRRRLERSRLLNN